MDWAVQTTWGWPDPLPRTDGTFSISLSSLCCSWSSSVRKSISSLSSTLSGELGGLEKRGAPVWTPGMKMEVISSWGSVLHLWAVWWGAVRKEGPGQGQGAPREDLPQGWWMCAWGWSPWPEPSASSCSRCQMWLTSWHSFFSYCQRPSPPSCSLSLSWTRGSSERGVQRREAHGSKSLEFL